MTDNIPLLSILCPTYNHEQYIAQALDGFVMQQTSFPFEIIVHDDASTDSTASIVRKYEAKYPHLFANIYQTENQFSKSIDNITKITVAAARGKYIALCEGDDYWVDDKKVERQVTFLENNLEYSTIFHQVYELSGTKLVLSNFNRSTIEQTYTIEDLALKNFIHTPSVVYRKGLINSYPEWLKKIPVGDYIINMLNAQKGKIKFLPQPMAVYRRHHNGTWGAKGEKFQIENWLNVLTYLTEEFILMPEVVDNLQYQFSSSCAYLADIFFKEDNREMYLKYMNMCIKHSQRFMNDWLIKNAEANKRLYSSMEYKIGMTVCHPSTFVTSLFSKFKSS